MPRKQSKPTNDDNHGWTVVLDSIISHTGRPDGDGWKTVIEIFSDEDLNPAPVTRNSIQKMMEDYIGKGLVERESGTSENGKRCYYYRPIQK